MTFRYVAAGDLVWRPCQGGGQHVPSPDTGVEFIDGDRKVFVPETLLADVTQALRKAKL